MADAPPAAPATVSRGPRLSLMMFLQYAVWGAWLPILARYLGAAPELNEAGERIGGGLGFDPGQIGLIAGTAGAVGAVTAPFIAGQVADRYFAAQRFMALLMVIGGIIMFILGGITAFQPFLLLSVAYSVVYMPSLAISNSIAFAHLKNPEKEFPPIRLWGTIGWIAVSWIFPMVWLQTGLSFQAMPPFLVGTEVPDVVARLADALRLSGLLSIAYGLYCLTLPHTPPARKAESIAFAKAFGLLRHRGVLVAAVVALPISIIHTIYFIQTPQFLPTLEGVRDSDIQPAMSIGQFSEILVLAALGFVLRGLGFRWVLTIGCLAYVGRYLVFGIGDPTWLVIASQALHGLCYACFFAAAFIYVERIASADVRHSAQTVFGIIILGIGPMLSGPILGLLAGASTEQTTVAAAIEHGNMAAIAPEDGWDALYPGAQAAVDEYAAGNRGDKASAWKGLAPETEIEALDYRQFWWICGGIGLVCALVMAGAFKLDPASDEEEPSLAEAVEGGAEVTQ